MNRILRCGGVLAALMIGATALAQTPAETKPDTDSTTTDNPKTDLDKIGDTMENIGARPLKDLNIIQEKVDPGR